MLRLTLTAATFLMALPPLAARAAEKTVVLDVDNATCELCAPIVKKTLSRVSGVKAIAKKAQRGCGEDRLIGFERSQIADPRSANAEREECERHYTAGRRPQRG